MSPVTPSAARPPLTPGPADVLLADGRLAVVRLLGPDDGPALHDLHERVSDEALRLRFFAVARHAAHTYVDHVLRSPMTLTLVAEVDSVLVAVATAEPFRPGTSEVAFLVADDFRGHGLGTLLLEHLAALAQDHGIRRFEADVLQENHAMLGVFADAGFTVGRRVGAGVVVVELSTGVTPTLQALADARESHAEARSLAPLLAPRSVALVGVRRDGSGIGAAVLRSIRSGGYLGRLTVVHPSASEVHGVPAVASLSAVAAGVDLAVIAVPAPAVAAALLDAAAAGVPAAVVISSGFEELGAEGAALQRELSTIARTHGIRVVGPNCLGLLANDPGVRLNATFNEAVPPAGGLAVASQSGGVGIVLMDLARELGLGIRTFVSLGNKADVSSNDLLAAWYDDPEVTAGALYLESFGNARKFARFARRFSERKPLLAVVGGRSVGGQRAGSSHTAAAATPAIGVRALFAQSGVIACRDAEDLAHTALLVTGQPLPRGPRVAVLTNAGGMGVLAADAAEDAGLSMPVFSDALRTRVATLVHGTTGTDNPVDAGAGVSADQLSSILQEIVDSGEVDAVVSVVVATGVTDGSAIVTGLDRVRASRPEVPVLLVPLGGLAVPEVHGLTSYRTTGAAVRSLGHAVRYSAWLSVPRTSVEPTDPDQVLELRREVGDLLDRADAEGAWVEPAASRHLLDAYGASLVGDVATGEAAVVALAERIGYPVVLKVADASVVHKTERRLVRVGLTGSQWVRRAVAEFTTELGREAPVLVQPVHTGQEVALGIVRDPSLGPMVMVAAGGIATDVWDDRVFLLPPFSPTDATRAIQQLRIWPLLQGFRGAVPADTDDLVRLLVAVGHLAVDFPEVAELDLNPVLVTAEGCAVVDTKLRLVATARDSVNGPRQLRPVR